MTITGIRNRRTATEWKLMFTLLACVMTGSIACANDEPLPLFATPVAVSPSTTLPVSPQVIPADVANVKPVATPQELQAQKDSKFRELKRQMEVLDQLVPTHSSKAPAPGAAPSVQAQPSHPPSHPQRPATNPAPGDPPPAHPAPRPAESVPHPGGGSPQAGSPAATTSQSVPVPHPGSTSVQKGSPERSQPSLLKEHDGTVNVPITPDEPDHTIVEGTIDRFALATSLFGTGQVDTCLDVLKYTDLKQLPREDQIWAEYIIACCQRRLGQIDEARQSYRRVLAEKDAEEIGKLARWWLDDLEEKAKLKADIQRLSETLAAWETEIDTLAKQSARAKSDP